MFADTPWTIIGYRKNGAPIYLIQGGAEDGADDGDTDDVAAEDGSDDGSAGAEGEDGAVTFASRDEFVKTVSKIVKTRVDRNNKKYAPVVAERDTLKAKVQEWQPIVEGKQTEDQKREANERELREQVNELLGYKRTNERTELVRRIAEDKGLPKEFIPRIQGDDEDAITADVEEFLDVLKLDKSLTKRSLKDTKPGAKDEGKGGRGAAGGAGRDSDEDVDPKKLAASIGRYGRNPYVVG